APNARNSPRGLARFDPNVRKARSRSESDGAGDAPDVDHVAAREVELPVGVVRGCDDEKLGFLQDTVQRQEGLVMDVGVGAKDPGALECGQLAQLVAQGSS